MATGWHSGEQVEHIPQWADRMKLPSSGPFGFELSFLVPHIILFPLTFFLAEVVMRAFDVPSVRLAARLYKKTLPGSSMTPSSTTPLRQVKGIE